MHSANKIDMCEKHLTDAIKSVKSAMTHGDYETNFNLNWGLDHLKYGLRLLRMNKKKQTKMN